MRLVLYRLANGQPIYVNPANVCDIWDDAREPGCLKLSYAHSKEGNGVTVRGDLAYVVALLSCTTLGDRRAELAAFKLGEEP